MNNIITTNSETITSMEVAQMIYKEHKYLLRDIRRYLNQIDKINMENLTRPILHPLISLLKTPIQTIRVKSDLATISLTKVANL